MKGEILSFLAYNLIRLGNWLYDQVPSCPNLPECSICDHCGECTWHGTPCVLGYDKAGKPILREV